MTEARLEDLLHAEDYPGCIQLLQECLKVAAAYRQYSCVSDMSAKLQDTLDMAEEQLDVGLSKVTLGRLLTYSPVDRDVVPAVSIGSGSDRWPPLSSDVSAVYQPVPLGRQLCTRFEAARYCRLQEAYRLLGKTQTAADQLLMHMTSAVHTASGQRLLAHLRPAAADQPLQKRQYADLCAVRRSFSTRFRL